MKIWLTRRELARCEWAGNFSLHGNRELWQLWPIGNITIAAIISVTLMKKHHFLLASILAGFTLVTARAQPGGPPTGPSWDGAMSKLFGDNSSFSATLEFHMNRSGGKEMVMPGKIAFSEGKARFEMDLSSMTGGSVPPQAAAQMKKMGMDKMAAITRNDKNVIYMVYVNMKAYVEMPRTEASAAVADYKSDITKVGAENVDGHECVKNKVVVTSPNGSTRESTVWNASDLKDFPIKIETASKDGSLTVLHFTEVKLEKPDAALFDPPADFTKYDNMMGLMMSGARAGRPQ